MSALIRSSFQAFTLAMLACTCMFVAQIVNTTVLSSNARNSGHVELLECPPMPAAKPSASPLPLSAPTAASPEFGSTLRQIGPESYSIQRQDVENMLANLSKLAMEARIVPAFRDGAAQGFKLFAMKPDSLYSRLGVKNGDTLRSINGIAMDGPNSAMAAYAQLRSASLIELELERNGQTLRKTCAVEP